MKRKISWPLPYQARARTKLYIILCAWLNLVLFSLVVRHNISIIFSLLGLVLVSSSLFRVVLPRMFSRESHCHCVLLGVCCSVSSPDLQSTALQPQGDRLRQEDQGQDERILQFSSIGGTLPPAERRRVGWEEAVSRLVPGKLSSAGEMSSCPAEQIRGSGQIINLIHWLVLL